MNIIKKPFFDKPALYIKGPQNQRKFARYRGQVQESSKDDQTRKNNNQQPIKVLHNKKTHEQNNYTDKYLSQPQNIIYSPKIVSPPIESEKIEQINEKHQSEIIEIQNEPPTIQILQKEELPHSTDIIPPPDQTSILQAETSQQIQLNQEQPQILNTLQPQTIQTFPIPQPLFQQQQQTQQQHLMPQQVPVPPIMYNLIPNANPYSPVPFSFGYQNPQLSPNNQPYIQSQCIFPNKSVTSTSFVLNAEEIQKYTQFLMEQLRIYELQNHISMPKPQ